MLISRKKIRHNKRSSLAKREKERNKTTEIKIGIVVKSLIQIIIIINETVEIEIIVTVVAELEAKVSKDQTKLSSSSSNIIKIRIQII